MDGPVVRPQRRPLVACVGMSRPPGRADGAAGVRTESKASTLSKPGHNAHVLCTVIPTLVALDKPPEYSATATKV